MFKITILLVCCGFISSKYKGILFVVVRSVEKGRFSTKYTQFFLTSLTGRNDPWANGTPFLKIQPKFKVSGV